MRQLKGFSLEMSLWQLPDSSTSVLEGFDIAWLPSGSYRYVTPHIAREPSKHAVLLESGPFAGAIPLLNGDTLHIVPRLGKRLFSRMLLVSEGLDEAIKEDFENYVQVGIEDGGDLPWERLLARPYLEELRHIEKTGLLSRRVLLRRRRQNAKGRIVVGPTLISISKMEDEPILCEYREIEESTPENRLLASGAASLLRMRVIRPDDPHYSVAVRWNRMLDDSFVTRTELDEVIANLENRKYSGARGHYQPALLMARLLLSGGEVVLDSDQSIESLPVLSYLPIIFERYVRIMLSRHFMSRGLIVEKRTGGRAPDVFLEGGAKIEPDIVISDGLQVNMVADVKYKPGESPSNTDYFQLLAYLNGFGSTLGTLILPGRGEDREIIMRRTASGLRVYELYLPTESPICFEEELIEGIAEILDL